MTLEFTVRAMTLHDMTLQAQIITDAFFKASVGPECFTYETVTLNEHRNVFECVVYVEYCD
jgi:hypothetical protein